jgi:hypothetical protein
LQRIEKEYEELKEEAPRLRAENERLRKVSFLLALYGVCIVPSDLIGK